MFKTEASGRYAMQFSPLLLRALLGGITGIALWVFFFTLNLPYLDVTGRPIVWHAHEMLSGFVLAALAGFMLKAVPAFTLRPAFNGWVGGVVAVF